MEYKLTFPLSNTEFEPRDIIDIVKNCSERDLQVYVEYICERLALLKDQRQQMRGADMAIVRIKDNQREFCENSGYNPMKDRFKYEDNSCYVIDPILDKEIRDYYQQGNEAINCYTKYYPTKEDENDSKENAVESPQTPETEVLQTKIRELESKITHQVGELQQQLTEKTQALQEAIQIIVVCLLVIQLVLVFICFIYTNTNSIRTLTWRSIINTITNKINLIII